MVQELLHTHTFHGLPFQVVVVVVVVLVVVVVVVVVLVMVVVVAVVASSVVYTEHLAIPCKFHAASCRGHRIDV